MHPETKKHALSNTDKESKATTKPWFSRLLRHPARKRSGSILGQTHTRLLTYLLAPDPHADNVAAICDLSAAVDQSFFKRN